MKKTLILAIFVIIYCNVHAQWTTLTIGTNKSLMTVFFTGPNTGYAAGVQGTIIKTVNGGDTWTTLNSGTSNQLFHCILLMQIPGMQ